MIQNDLKNANVTVGEKNKTKAQYEKVTEKSLEDLIRENSGVSCEICEFKAKSLKQLKVQKAKKHTKVAESGGKLYSQKRDENIYQMKCNICGFEGIMEYGKKRYESSLQR